MIKLKFESYWLYENSVRFVVFSTQNVGKYINKEFRKICDDMFVIERVAFVIEFKSTSTLIGCDIINFQDILIF